MSDALKNILLIMTPSVPLNAGLEQGTPLNRRSMVSIYPPLGICYLSSFLKSKGCRVEILDLELELHCLLKEKRNIDFKIVERLICEKIKIAKPDIIGISCIIAIRYKQMHQICEIIKNNYRDIPLIAGGNYPTNSPEMVLKDKNIDYVVLGEGEIVFWNLIRALEKSINLESVGGLGYKVNGEIRINERQRKDFIMDLDILPFPDYGQLSLDKYYNVGNSQSLEVKTRFINVFTSRGCPWGCIYCGARNIFGNKYRFRSAENVLAEIDWLVKEHNIEELEFQDDNLLMNRERANKILDGLIERGYKLSWTTPNGLDVSTLDKALLEKIRRSGGKNIAIAVESANPRVLDMICKKNVDLVKVKEIVRICKEMGIYIKAFFMLGFPGETKEEMQDTINYAARLKADWSDFNIVNPLPGTVLAKIVAEKGYLLNSKDEYGIGYANANIATEEFTPEYVEELAYDANIRLNFLNNPNLHNSNVDIAIRDFNRIANRYPDHLIARYCLGKALIKKGLKEEGLIKWSELGVESKKQKGKQPSLLDKYCIDLDREIWEMQNVDSL